MKFIFELQNTLKNGFYIDYFFKNIIFNLYTKFILSNFSYIVDKYLAEQFFFHFKKFFSFFFFVGNFVKSLDTLQLIKIVFLLVIQILLIILL
jgi:hypothetical protein